MVTSHKGPHGHSSSVQANMPHMCHSLRTEKAWMLGSSPSVACLLPASRCSAHNDLQPIMLPDNFRPRNAGTELVWAVMQRGCFMIKWATNHGHVSQTLPSLSHWIPFYQDYHYTFSFERQDKWDSPAKQTFCYNFYLNSCPVFCCGWPCWIRQKFIIKQVLNICVYQTSLDAKGTQS